MSQLISQLLSMTRLEQGTESACLAPVNLNGLLRSHCEELAYSPDRLILELHEDITAMADPTLLSRLVRNLVENGFKYSEPNGCVWVSVRQSGGEILLEVRDNGIGIPAELQEKIWQRFYRADPARGGEGGAGLGLPIVRQIAHAHGGYMTLESIPGWAAPLRFICPRRAPLCSRMQRVRVPIQPHKKLSNFFFKFHVDFMLAR